MTVIVRRATIFDTDFVWQLRQQTLPDMARKSKVVESLDRHQSWMKLAVQREDSLFLIAEENREPLGYVRFDSMDGVSAWLVSICIKPSAQGGGRGQAALKAGCDEADQKGMTPQFADIHVENSASIKAFGACGFCPFVDEPKACDYYRYVRWSGNKELQ